MTNRPLSPGQPAFSVRALSSRAFLAVPVLLLAGNQNRGL